MAEDTVDRSSGPVARVARALAKVESNEIRATVLSFTMVFVLMAAYYMLRPVRDAMASDWSGEEVGVLWTVSFVVSLVAVVVYGALISPIPFRRIVPRVYVFFSAAFFVFYGIVTWGQDIEIVRQVFYVWVTLFALFNTSVFWTFMSGLFNRQQAPRLFGIIAVGASLGAIAGPAVPTFFAGQIGSLNLMPIAALMLLIPLPIIGRLELLKTTELGNAGLDADLDEHKRLGRNPFSGIGILFSNRFLLGIGVFIFLYVLMSTIFYQELRAALRPLELDHRTQIQSGIDLAVNTLAILTAMFVTGRVATRFGMATVLAIIPLLLAGGWLIVAAAPLLPVLVGMQIARRAGNYAVTRPGREMLFTTVDPEARYKAKPVVDIVVYRGGDVVNVWFYNWMTAAWGLGLGLTGVAIVAAVLSLVWATVGAMLGRSYNERATDPPPAAAPVRN